MDEPPEGMVEPVPTPSPDQPHPGVKAPIPAPLTPQGGRDRQTFS